MSHAPAVLPRLYAIVDVDIASRAGWAPRDLTEAYLSGGARLLQLRAKHLGGAAFLDLARELMAMASAAGAQLIVNDRADIAVLAQASGVHVGQDDISPEDVRLVAGATPLVGWSTHTRSQIDAAIAAPVSYFAIGPVFGTGTKATGYDAVGLEMVAHAAACGRSAGLPVAAIGGITLTTAPSVIAAGAATVAVITDLVTDNPESRVRSYVTALE